MTDNGMQSLYLRPAVLAHLERPGRRRARGRAMTAAVFAFLGFASLAAAQARPQEYRFAGLQWGASETEVRNVLTLKQFRRISPTVNGHEMVGKWWAGELLGLRVTVEPLLVENQLLSVWVDVRPSGTMSSKAMVDSVRRVLVRDYGEPRVVAPGILSWGSGHLCFFVPEGADALLLEYRNPNEDTSGSCMSKDF